MIWKNCLAAVMALSFLILPTRTASARAQAFTPIRLGIDPSGSVLFVYVQGQIPGVCGDAGTRFRINLSDTPGFEALVSMVTAALLSGRSLWIQYPDNATCEGISVDGANWFVMM